MLAAVAIASHLLLTPPSAEAEKTAPPQRDRELYFEPGVAIWLRGQARHNPDYTRPGPDAIDLFSRLRLQALLRWRAWGVFAQVQDHRAWGGRNESASVPGAVGFHQGWAEIVGKRQDWKGSIRVGRQEIGWGKHRLIGTFPWAASGRSFDAIQLHGELKWVGLEMFYAMIERPRMFDVTDATMDPPVTTSVHTRGVHLGAARLHATPHKAFAVEAMGLVDYAEASPTALTRERLVGDLGARVWGEPLRWLTYDVEAHGQVGRMGQLLHRAWAFASTLRGQAPLGRVAPGVQLGYAIASGHACNGPTGTACAPSESNDFYNFYPTNHPHYGILDQFGWSNMRDAEGGVFVKNDVFEASAIYHFFQMHQRRGSWRDSGGNFVGAGWDLDEPDVTIGHEVDLLVTAKLWKPVWLQPGYGVFLPTAAGARLAGHDVQQFVFLWVIVELSGPL